MSLQHYCLILKHLAAFPNIAGTKEFRVLLMRGTYNSHNNRVYLAGACNVGKSTLASNLIGDNILLEWNSTDGLVIYFGRNGIDLEKKEMVPLPKGPQDSGILTSVLRGQPTMGQTAAATEGRHVEKGHALLVELDSLAIVSDTPTFENIDHSSKIMLSSEPSQAKSLSQSSIKREKKQQVAKSKSHHRLMRSKQEKTDIRQSIMEAIRKREYKVRIGPSDLVDFGGQKAFDLTHQLFIQQKGAFVLLLDGRKHLDEILAEYQDGKMTIRDILLHWVNSILTYCAVGDDDIDPLIVFAATHCDKLKREEEHIKSENFTEQLIEIFSSHEHSKRIRYQEVFFINALNRNDSGVHSLKQFLVNVAYQQKSWGDQMPMAWVPLELQMADLRTNNFFIISYDELINLNISNGDLSLAENNLKIS